MKPNSESGCTYHAIARYVDVLGPAGILLFTALLVRGNVMLPYFENLSGNRLLFSWFNGFGLVAVLTGVTCSTALVKKMEPTKNVMLSAVVVMSPAVCTKPAPFCRKAPSRLMSPVISAKRPDVFRTSSVLFLIVGRHRPRIRPSLVRASIDAGWEIDSHTVTHADLPGLSAAQLKFELQQSRAMLVVPDYLETDVTTFVGVPGNPGQDPAAQFGIIVKRELVVGPSSAGEQFVGSALAFHAPAEALQGSRHAAGFSRRPVAHSVPGRRR